MFYKVEMEISIITINYNNAIGLLETLKSVIQQDFQAFEYIVVDGGSTDESIDAIKKCERYIDYWISEPDKGIYDAMNKGIEKCTAKYIMFLNSGDVFVDKQALQVCSTIIDNHKDVHIFYGDIIGKNHPQFGTWIHTHPSLLTIEFFKKGNINHQASFISSSLFKELGLYPSQYKLSGDHWLFLKSYVKGKKFKHINRPIVIYDYSGASAVQRQKYVQEMNIIWKSLIPEYVDDLIAEKKQLHFQSSKRLVKFAIQFHKHYNFYKSKFFNK